MISFDPDLNIYTSSLINNKFFGGFATRQLGDGMHLRTIVDFLKESEINFEKVIVPGQIHSSNIEVINKQNENNLIEDTDGLITKEKNIVLTVRTADCLPIIFCDEKNGAIGISHQGWRGSLKKMAIKMVEKMMEEGANRENIKVMIGPGIGLCCYDVDDDRYFEFLEEGYPENIFRTIKGRRHLNLTLLNYLLLIEAGIKKENIDFFPFCTSCNEEKFFSFRRDKHKHKQKNLQEMFSFVLTQ